MTTEEKLQQIVDKLLVKTQDNRCNWKKESGNKFILRMPVYADIVMYIGPNINSSYHIILDIVRDDTVIASLYKDQKETESTLVRLFRCVISYNENYVNDQLSKLMDELQKLGDKPI